MAKSCVDGAPVAGNAHPIPFAFKDHPIRTVVDHDGNPWFVAKDVCAALSISWRGDTLAGIKPEWKGMRTLRTHSSGARGGGDQCLRIISEPAVYKLAFRSQKPEADEFTNWVASEVLPTIRKTGGFTATVQAKPEPDPTPAGPSPLSHLAEGPGTQGRGTLARTSASHTAVTQRGTLASLMEAYIEAMGLSPSPQAYQGAWRTITTLCGVMDDARPASNHTDQPGQPDQAAPADQVAQAEAILQALIDAARPASLHAGSPALPCAQDPKRAARDFWDAQHQTQYQASLDYGHATLESTKAMLHRLRRVEGEDRDSEWAKYHLQRQISLAEDLFEASQTARLLAGQLASRVEVAGIMTPKVE